MKNTDLREFAKLHKVRLWQVAEAVGVSECTFSKSLRHELPPERKEVIYEKIREISSQS